MEFSNLTINSRPCLVLFTGDKYIFKDNFCGVFAVAETDRAQETNDDPAFIVTVGNEYAPAGDNEIYKRVQNFIRRNENKFIQKKVSFELKKFDLRRCYISVSVQEYK